MDAIVADRVTKTYRIGVGRARVREMLPWPLDRGVARMFPRWWRRNLFNALEDVSVDIASGSSVGVVGHNGAGKTTLLKVVSGVTAPTTGAVRTSGRIGALIDVLVGFHPDLTGRENTYLLGAINGYGRRAMNRRIGQIMEFAEIDRMADTPVKRFSAGMMSRLGFAILVGIEPEVLLIDEVLAVGDAGFQRKCIDWLDGYRSRGGTLVFVSHNLGLVRSMTDRILWLDHGKLVGDGPSDRVLPEYVRTLGRREDEEDRPALRRRRGIQRTMSDRGLNRWGAGGARVQEVRIEEPSANGAGIEIAITYEAPALEEAVFAVGFIDEAGQEIGAAASPAIRVRGGGGTVRCVIRPTPFRAGIYFPVAAILSPAGEVQDRWRLDRAVVVDPAQDATPTDGFGPVAIPSKWSKA